MKYLLTEIHCITIMVNLATGINSILKNTYLTSENAGTMNRLHYVGVMYCRFILFEMMVDLACTLMN